MSTSCSIANCSRPVRGRGFCNRHYLKWWQYGDPLAGTLRAENGTGGRHSQGYRTVRMNGKQRLEHVVVAERVLGRPLPPLAKVHHVNEARSDNRHANLVICPDEA